MANEDKTMTLEAAVKANPGIGRRRLMKLTGRTSYACASFLAGRPEAAAATPAKMKKTMARPLPDGKGETQGILLRDARVVDTRPNEGIKHLLFGLRKGMGFPVQELAEQWGVSEETLKRHANKYGALKYVETDVAVWTHCVLHPDTALDYKSTNRSAR